MMDSKPEIIADSSSNHNSDENISIPTNIEIYGIDYDNYKVSYKGKFNFKQCGYCLKFFPDKQKGFITKTNDQEAEYICYHCLFWINYSPELRQTVDGVYDKTIHDYILETLPYHDTETCSKRGQCFVCDHVSGIKIDGIFGNDDLYNTWKSKNDIYNDISDFKIIIKI